MRSTPEERAKAVSKAIAAVRMIKHQFEYQELMKLLQHEHCPYWNIIPALLIEKNVLVKINNRYEFINNEPIHFKSFQHVLDAKVKAKQNKPAQIEKILVTDYDAMIQILKNLGHKIQRQVVIFEDC
jgi:hypothetical protein